MLRSDRLLAFREKVLEPGLEQYVGIVKPYRVRHKIVDDDGQIVAVDPSLPIFLTRKFPKARRMLEEIRLCLG